MTQPTGQSGGKNHWGLHRFGPQRSQSHQCYESFGLTDFNGGWWLNTLSIRECQFVNSSADYGTTGGGRRERSNDVGANSNLELVLVSGGERTR